MHARNGAPPMKKHLPIYATVYVKYAVLQFIEVEFSVA